MHLLNLKQINTILFSKLLDKFRYVWCNWWGSCYFGILV